MIRVNEATQLRELYIIKLERDIFMLKPNVKNLIELKKDHVDLKLETKGDEIREQIEDNSIRTIFVQSKALKGHAAKLKEQLNYSLK